MPRVSEAHRRARRDEIADAALRVLVREGVSSTSIAQIVQESGLSAGAIYANFENKAALATYIASSVLDWRMERLGAAVGSDLVRSPFEVLSDVLHSFEDESPPIRVVLQYWGEATTDEDLHAVLAETASRLRDVFERAVGPWAVAESPEDAGGLARSTATTMLVLCQGYLAHTGLLGWVTPDEYLASATAIFASGADSAVRYP